MEDQVHRRQVRMTIITVERQELTEQPECRPQYQNAWGHIPALSLLSAVTQSMLREVS